MSHSLPHPKSLDTWLALLEELPLPVPQEQEIRIRRTLENSQCSLREVCELLENCPTLALAVLREANLGKNDRSQFAESLESALKQLGFLRTLRLLEQLPILPEAQIPTALEQLLLISQHAMQQANGLFAKRLARIWQDIQWGSLLALAPLWALATARPALMEEWLQHPRGLGQSSLQLELDLFGTQLLPLCQALAERWHLPTWGSQDLLLLNSDRHLLHRALRVALQKPTPEEQQRYLDENNELARWLTRPAHCILLANALAMAAHQSWGSAPMQRWQALSSLYLQLPKDEVVQQIHNSAAQSARSHSHPALWHPAQALLWPQPTKRWSLPSKAPVTAPKPATAEPWREHCAELLKTPTAFANAQQLLDSLVAALQACGLQQGRVLLADTHLQCLRVRRSFGMPTSHQEQLIDDTSHPLLRTLLQQPAQLHLSPTQSARLPTELQALLPKGHLLLRSLGNGKRVVILLIIGNHEPLDDRQEQAFAYTAQCIEQAIQQLARNQS